MNRSSDKSKKTPVAYVGAPNRARTLRVFIKYFLFSRWVFLPPKPKKILQIDGIVYPFKSYFKKKDLNILYRRGEEINIFVLLSCLINFQLSTKSYYKKYIYYSKPKIILAPNNTSRMFYNLSKLTNVKTACIQWGKQTLWDGVFANKYICNRKNKKKLFIDYIFTYNEKVSKKFSSFCGGQAIEIGSFLNNIKRKKRKKKKEILFISTHKNFLDTTKGWGNFTHEFFFNNDKYVIKCLSDFAYKNNLKLNVLGRCLGNFSISEKKFFDKLIGRKYKFIPAGKERDTYGIVDEFEYIFTIDSTLAIEAFVRDGKVGSIFNRPNVYPVNTRRNGGFEKLPHKGSFWTTCSANNRKEFNRVMNFVVKASNMTWKKLRKKYGKKFMVYDEGNKKFLKIINQNINQK